MKPLRLLVLITFIGCTAASQTYTPTPENIAMRNVFQSMRYGLFVHWGPFSIPGEGEWVMNNRNISFKNYTRLENFFNPADFDAAAFVRMAKDAGMKYITLITRHHDGFSMFDTRYSDFNIMNTPYKKDVVKMVADECHKEGIQLFLYYSLLDWRRDDYAYWTGNSKSFGRTKQGNWENYIQFMKNQLTELLTNYGEIGGIWFDGYWDQFKKDINGKRLSETAVDWHMPEIYALIHKLQPHCLIGNNHHMAPLPGEDFQMFEKDLPGANTTGFGGAAVSTLPLETCETMNDSWGFNLTDVNYKSVKELLHYMLNAAGRDANFLLNIGPMPNGAIQQEFKDTLAAVGAWLQTNGESYYGTRGNIIPTQSWGVVTAKGKTIYAHILNAPASDYIFIPGLTQKLASVSLFSNKAPLKYKQQTEGTFVFLKEVAHDEVDTIVQLNLK